uniref:T9SS type A sorting domain-containing protein n=1 Tax=uncultured Dokdonia sp. TaxID=575653 RepID=UPI0026198245
ADGSFYVYVEASGNGTGFPNKRAILNSPCFDLSGESEASFIFDYHMFGSTDGGRVDLEASTDDGATWTSIWNQTGNQGNQWNNVTIDLAAYVGGSVQLRFNRITGGTWQSDVAIDNTRVVASGGNTGCSTVDLNTTYNSFSNQDNGTSQLLNGNTELKLEDNAWKYINFPYTITANTVIQLDFRSDIQGEIHGIGLESDNTLSSDLVFQFHGTQNWGILDFNNYSGNGWVTYTIPVGTFYTGAADRLLFVTDHDASPSNGDSFYRNITVFEDANGNGVCDNSESNVVANFGGDENTNPVVGNNSIEGVEFEIFPNPTKGVLNINIGDLEAENYTIYNTLGQVVRQSTFTNVINVANLKDGMYIIEVEVDGSKMIQRFIKK